MRSPYLLLSCLLLLLALASRAPAAAVLTREEYAGRLEQVARALAEGGDAGKGAAARAERALESLPERATVKSDAGKPAVEVDNRELLRRLREMARGGPEGLRNLRGAVESLRGTAAQAGGPPNAKARATLEAVLAGKEFQLSWWERKEQEFWLWVEEMRRKLPLPDMSGEPLGLGPKVWRNLGIGLLVACGALALYFIVRLLSRSVPKPKGEQFTPEARPKLILPASAWLAEAKRCLEAGDHRAGVRALHMAALMKLDEAGLVRYDTAYTDRRFVRALQSGGKPETARALAGLNHLFARIWYGRMAAGPREYADADALWREVEGQVAT